MIETLVKENNNEKNKKSRKIKEKTKGRLAKSQST